MKKRLMTIGTFVWTTLIIFMLASCQSAPEASFSASPTSGSAPLNVSFTNTSSEADEYIWNFGDGGSTTTYSLTESATHEYDIVGTYTVNLTASKGEKPLTGSAVQTITVSPGSLSKVIVTPETVELGIGEMCDFSGMATDNYGNEITGASTDWRSDLGSVSNGQFTAGTKAGLFPEGVALVMEKDGVEVTGYASVMINPGPMETLAVDPIEIIAGQAAGLHFTARDANGNPIEGLDATWSLAAVYTGSVTESGTLTASKKAGTVTGVIQVKVQDGDKTLSAIGDVTVVAGDLTQVGIAPDPVEIGIGMMQQMVAAGADQYGNRISGLELAWNTSADAGSIVTDGLFTAGDEADTYADAITVTATQGTTTVTASVAVTVVPDRIVFLSDMNDIGGTPEWFIMNADGTEPEQLTFDVFLPSLGACVSPDGRRFLYTDFGELLIINTDGEWASVLISDQLVGEPTFSPDGSKIALQFWGGDLRSEICTIDIDGGNLVQLTDNDYYDDYPTWSPDGKQIAFISDRQNANGGYSIFVMDADGSNQRALTSSNLFSDMSPRWSPVNNDEIVFFSDRLYGRYSLYILNPSNKAVTEIYSDVNMYCLYAEWSPDGKKIAFTGVEPADIDNLGEVSKSDIYTISKTGSSLTRLTDNGSVNLNPKFVPRMQGVTVTEASVIFPDTPTDIVELKTEDMTALVKDSIVRIKTDLGSGSGFVISADGLILTNNHVVSDAETITVYFSDGSEYNGTVQARDLIHDIAVVKVSKTGLHALQFKDASSIKLGQQVVVLGYALGKENLSVTSGLVSSIEYDSGRNINWIQTDSAINGGNSGGPMLDREGNVIGMVSAKLVGISVEGVGFAVSSNTINTYLPQLLNGEDILSFE